MHKTYVNVNKFNTNIWYQVTILYLFSVNMQLISDCKWNLLEKKKLFVFVDLFNLIKENNSLKKINKISIKKLIESIKK